MGTFVTYSMVVLGLSVLVIVHETGHYLVARAFGMKVLRYSIGIGPTLFRYKPRNSPTTFQVCAIPFAAYVQIAGMNPFEEVDEKDPGLFSNKSLLGRVLTVAAGPAANYLLASVVVFGLVTTGWTQAVVGEVFDDSPAQAAGLREGDIIVRANHKPVYRWEDLILATAQRADKPTQYVIMRDGKELPVQTITPELKEGRGIIGVYRGEPAYRPTTIGEAARAAVVVPMNVTLLQVYGLYDQISRRTTDGLVGPVGMGKIISNRVEQGWFEYLFILVMLSVALGFFNLLPFPALDGGRLVFLAYEAITRRRPSERFEAAVHTLGFVILLSLVAFVTMRDIWG
ncbi:MAG: site-2 protease family protein [Myxococcales bacterium]|nr:site-2 protease family protein [Myxococcales bacterium]